MIRFPTYRLATSISLATKDTIHFVLQRISIWLLVSKLTSPS